MTKPPEKEIALETRALEGARLFSPSAARNRDPIRAAFVAHMPALGTVLEIGSGTGEHVAHLAAALPEIRWLPGDPDATSRASIAAWVAHAGLGNVDPPHALDVTARDWDGALPALDGALSINAIHIAPIEAAEGLVGGAGRRLKAGGKLFLYGPFARNGVHVAPTNAEFDASLKKRDPRWGVRDLDREIVPRAAAAGLALDAVVPMPANNLSVVFVRR